MFVEDEKLHYLYIGVLGLFEVNRRATPQIVFFKRNILHKICLFEADLVLFALFLQNNI